MANELKVLEKQLKAVIKDNAKLNKALDKKEDKVLDLVVKLEKVTSVIANHKKIPEPVAAAIIKKLVAFGDRLNAIAHS